MKHDTNSLRLLALSFRAIDGIINGERPKIIHRPRKEGLCDKKTALLLMANTLKAREEYAPAYMHPDKRAKNRAKRKRKARK